ncbi:unnamed protein product [Rotaria sp. Silwood2]|nr:unnamed protein product [Rotaria sp. Silwood2]CAF4154798.1 unnamed protein product [Rotaria sp. Silwood2]CAF4330928.1 unnamed protein product [Rotaria sp. Silwood2]
MIYYDYKKQLSQEQCLESLHKTFGDSCVSRATVYNWFAKFSRGRDHFEDEPRAGRPRTAVTPENIEAVRELSKRVYDIITGEESWFYYYDPKTKRQSQVWVASNDPHPTKVRRQRSVGKQMFAIFFMKSCFNTIIPLENGKIVTAKWYANKCLTQVLKQVEKYRRLNGLLIHHDNAPA